MYFVGDGLAPALVEQVPSLFFVCRIAYAYGQGQAQPLQNTILFPKSFLFLRIFIFCMFIFLNL
jgi:hypothetical protein